MSWPSADLTFGDLGLPFNPVSIEFSARLQASMGSRWPA